MIPLGEGAAQVAGAAEHPVEHLAVQRVGLRDPAFLAAFADAAKFSVKPPAPIDENSPFNG